MTATKIEWAEHTWNPVAGCTRVNAACDNCYAVRMTHRLEKMGQADKYGGLTVLNPRGDRHFNGQIKLIEDALTIPLKRRKPTTYFVNSMSDVFHDDMPFEFVDKIMAVIALCPQHRFIILTKRPKRMREYLGDNKQRGRAHPAVRVGEETAIYVHCWSDDDKEELEHRLENWPLPNLILGVSVHDQASADEFIPELLATPAACRAVSYEPALGPVVLPYAFLCRSCQKIWSWPRPVSRINPSCPKCDAVYSCRHAIDWLIAGGESGPGARPAHPDWFRQARDQCAAAGVPFFFKQWNKKRAGRLLDGCEHNELPEMLK